jgi:hypothetical protein
MMERERNNYKVQAVHHNIVHPTVYITLQGGRPIVGAIVCNCSKPPQIVIPQAPNASIHVDQLNPQRSFLRNQLS